MAPIENGFPLRLYALSSMGDSSGRGRHIVDRTRSVATTDTILLPSNPWRIWALLVNTGATDVFLRFGEDAALHTGIPLLANGGWCLINWDMPWTGDVHAIAETAASIVAGEECNLQGTTPEPVTDVPGPPAPPAPPVVKFGKC